MAQNNEDAFDVDFSSSPVGTTAVFKPEDDWTRQSGRSSPAAQKAVTADFAVFDQEDGFADYVNLPPTRGKPPISFRVPDLVLQEASASEATSSKELEQEADYVNLPPRRSESASASVRHDPTCAPSANIGAFPLKADANSGSPSNPFGINNPFACDDDLDVPETGDGLPSFDEMMSPVDPAAVSKAKANPFNPFA